MDHEYRVPAILIAEARWGPTMRAMVSRRQAWAEDERLDNDLPAPPRCPVIVFPVARTVQPYVLPTIE